MDGGRFIFLYHKPRNEERIWEVARDDSAGVPAAWSDTLTCTATLTGPPSPTLAPRVLSLRIMK